MRQYDMNQKRKSLLIKEEYSLHSQNNLIKTYGYSKVLETIKRSGFLKIIEILFSIV
jgi:hypothetical protein